MIWEYQFKVCTGFKMLKGTQVLDLYSLQGKCCFFASGESKRTFKSPSHLKKYLFSMTLTRFETAHLSVLHMWLWIKVSL